MRVCILFCLLGTVFCASTHHPDEPVQVTTPKQHTTQPIGQDHLLNVLQAMHKSMAFRHLPPAEKVILVELLSAAEVDAVTHYIDTIGFSRVLTFLDHVTRINATEAHLLEEYLTQELSQETSNPQTPNTGQGVIGKRDIVSFLQKLQQRPTYQGLPTEDQTLIEELFRASMAGTLTPVIHREGYAKVIKLIEDIGNTHETHAFITYLVNQLNKEAKTSTVTLP